MTPLHEASCWDKVDVAQFLIEHGADVAAQSKDGTTPLHEASGMGSVDAARLLIEHGADVSAQRVDGMTPLQLSLCQWQSQDGTPLDPVFPGLVDVAQLLIEHGADAVAPTPGPMLDVS
jgi:ankyrin